MSTTAETQNAILVAGRKLIGRSYATLDCSHFVHDAYAAAGLDYPYQATARFAELATGPDAKFVLVPNAQVQAGDVILMKGHMGLWDPQGCSVIVTNRECVKLKGNAPFLSSRSGGNRGPDYGVRDWWGKDYRVFRWADFVP